MASTDVKKVLQLKHQLKECTEGTTLLKTLKKLQELDITLDILAETGIGKVVNSFRKHDDAGEIAKSLVHQWKKLVPKDPSCSVQPHPPSLKEPAKPESEQMNEEEESQASKRTSPERKNKHEDFGPEYKPSRDLDAKIKVKPSTSKLRDGTDSENKDSTKKDPVDLVLQTSKNSVQSIEKSTSYHHSEPKEGRLKKNEKKVSDITNKHRSSMSTKRKPDSIKEDFIQSRDVGRKDNQGKKRKEKDIENDDFEVPSMSFEEYLSYDLEAPKRKKKSCNAKDLKGLKPDQNEFVKQHSSSRKSSSPVTEALPTLAPKPNVMDLLKVPLPTILPEDEDFSQHRDFMDKGVEEKTADVCEAPVFTGQRMNKKMLVYSGSKTAYLPTMMTLYQQCIRTLQNNIDLLYEIGGVPFEILEPVLERCTSEQLLRIEECNPVYIGVTDHLWEKHCHREFRSAQLEEYESWRELYLRLFQEREQKFQLLTKSIVSAHSRKPRGRQVKMAFMHSAAKPPRNIRIQQEIHGTAGPVLPNNTDKSSVKSNENKGRPCVNEPAMPSSTSSGSSQPQEPKKIKRVAPMMAKSLKAFKKQLGRR
ncbi:elongin-A-like [Trichomycterus rosablanca]|uniref:elongin-A-like n=1 Tax=Trichomycterus rosablanca TaxID=2290929 RepID=UPI002F355E7B